MQDRLGEADALAITLRQLADGPVEDDLDPGGGDCGVERLRAGAAGELPQVGDKRQVVAHQHVAVQGVVLGEIADPALRLARRLGKPHTIERDLARVRLVVLGDEAHRGRLPGAIGPEEADHLTAVDRE